MAVALAILRALSEVEGWRHSWAGGADVLQQLADDGVVPVLLGMLRDLRPIQNPRRQQQVQQGQLPAADGAAGDTSSSRAAGQEAGEQAASAAAEVVQDQDQGSAATASSSSSNRTYPHEPSYPGYRSDIVAVLANASCERPSVQQVRAHDQHLHCTPGVLAPGTMLCPVHTPHMQLHPLPSHGMLDMP